MISLREAVRRQNPALASEAALVQAVQFAALVPHVTPAAAQPR